MKHLDCCSPSQGKVEAPKAGKPGHASSVFDIVGADCADEVNAIKVALARSDISSVEVNLIASTATVFHDPATTRSAITSLIESTGVKVVEREGTGFYGDNKTRIKVVASAGALLLISMILQWKGLVKDGPLAIAFLFPTLLAGSLVFPKALRALKQKQLDMNVLMSVAAIGAFAIKEYSEAATVVFLFSLAELLESYSLSRARNAIKSIMKLTPQTAHLKSGDTVADIPVTEIKPDQMIQVRPGESIPLDGLVVAGQTTANESALTGESLPVEKNINDKVFAGTVNGNGTIEVRVTQGFKDTKLSKILSMIEDAQSKKAPSERFVDSFAKIYTPAVFILALGIATIPSLMFGQSFDVWFYRALVLLVIACPCALVISTPVSVVSGLAALARKGVLVKGGKYLEALGNLKAIAMDKTGTLTEGRFVVQKLKLLGSSSEENVLMLAASLEDMSKHPLARAIQTFTTKVKRKSVADYKILPGQGAEGTIDGEVHFAGNHRLAHDIGACSPQIESHLAEFERQALSVVIIGRRPKEAKPESLAIFAMGDKVRDNAKISVEHLRRIGIENVSVLSGDNQRTVDAIISTVGVDSGFGDLLPEDKVNRIKALRETFKNIAMVGDGVNDAPAMANATVGISMGAIGTDAAIETSDVALMQDNLEEIPKAIELGRKVLSVIRFNIAFALAIKAVFLLLAVLGMSNLWLAVAADMGASLFVTANALRLLRT